MPISFDPAKNERTIAKRGIPFDLVEEIRVGHGAWLRKANPRETKRYEAQAQYETKDSGES